MLASTFQVLRLKASTNISGYIYNYNLYTIKSNTVFRELSVIVNHHGNTPLNVSVRVFPDRFNLRAKGYPGRGHAIPWAGVLD